MKDSMITAKQKKRELIYFLICFVCAFLLNLYSIIKYKHSAIEIINQIHLVLLVTLVIYAITVAFRFLWYIFAILYKKIIKA